MCRRRHAFKNRVACCLLAYDTTNFYTYIASTNDRADPFQLNNRRALMV
jgi:hypothetical protein